MFPKALIALPVLLALSAPASARGRHQPRVGLVHGLGAGLAHMIDSARPRAWCGWQMRQWMGERDPAYNLARNWAHYGRATFAHVGAIVVWPHHVGRIVGEQNGAWLVQSGNDGHAIRTRPLSVAGAIAFRE